jgi:hypothetical protein
VVQEAVLQYLAAGGSHDGGAAMLTAAIRSRINGITANLRRKKCLRAVTLAPHGSTLEYADPFEAEERIVGLDWTKKAFDVLLDRISGDNVVLAMVGHMANGVTDPSRLAGALGSDVRQVYNARRRLQTHVMSARKTLEATC